MSAATITLLFLLFAVVMFVFEKIPLGVTSMATLRKKLEPTEESPQYIQTHIGVGYRMIKVE